MPGQTRSPSQSAPAETSTDVSTPSREVSQPEGNAVAAAEATGQCDPNAVKLPGSVAPNGELDYYERRNSDFGTRYAGCGLTPPVYYINYGKKYADRFTNEVSPKLSAQGQAWLGRARVNLQTAIEGRRDADPAAFDELEKNNGAFTAFAYGTHADAYWNAGLGDLPFFDLVVIGLTPDVRDLVAWDGVTQVADIGSRLLGAWGTRFIDFMMGEGTTQQLISAAYSGFQVIGDEIDEVFGAGTAAALVDGAAQLGQDAAVLAHDAYGVASDVVEFGVDAVESVTGEGSVESTIDAGREKLQSGADWAGDVWDDIWN